MGTMTAMTTTFRPALAYDGHELTLDISQAATVLESPAYEATDAHSLFNAACFRVGGGGAVHQRYDDLTLSPREVPVSEFSHSASNARMADDLGRLLPHVAHSVGATLLLPTEGGDVLDYDSYAHRVPVYRTTEDVVRGADLACQQYAWKGPVAVPVNGLYVVLSSKTAHFDRESAESLVSESLTAAN